jgi:hypothetical protein
MKTKMFNNSGRCLRLLAKTALFSLGTLIAGGGGFKGTAKSLAFFSV